MSIAEISAQLIDLSRLGLQFGQNPHEAAKYHQIQVIAKRLRRVRQDLDPARPRITHVVARTPVVGADAAIFRADGRLLLTERADGRGWCLPGGLVEVGEPPWLTVVRETREELCLTVRPIRLVAVYDNRRLRRDATFHAIQHIYQCEILRGDPALTDEVTDFGWYNAVEAQRLRIFSPHVTVIPELYVQSATTRFH